MLFLGRIALFFTALLGCTGCATQYGLDESTVTDFDLRRYLGKWYEIARFDHSFERGLSHVTAEYSLRDDGKVRVLNSGNNSDGERTYAQGKAKLVNNDNQYNRGELEVAFFLNFYAPYRILALGEEYEYALVSSGSDYLWILSREPTLEPRVLQMLLDEAYNRGFDTSALITVEQD